jgi:hypothetical protein
VNKGNVLLLFYLQTEFFFFFFKIGNEKEDVIENYSVRYRSELQCFVFRNRPYKSLREFVQDPEYLSIFRFGLPNTSMDIKPSKYSLDSDLPNFSKLQLR